MIADETGGKDAADQQDSLRKYEMRLGRITTRVDASRLPGTVLEQSPAAAAMAPRLTPVDLVIGARAAAADASGSGSRGADGGRP